MSNMNEIIDIPIFFGSSNDDDIGTIIVCMYEYIVCFSINFFRAPSSLLLVLFAGAIYISVVAEHSHPFNVLSLVSIII